MESSVLKTLNHNFHEIKTFLYWNQDIKDLFFVDAQIKNDTSNTIISYAYQYKNTFNYETKYFQTLVFVVIATVLDSRPTADTSPDLVLVSWPCPIIGTSRERWRILKSDQRARYLDLPPPLHVCLFNIYPCLP